MKKGNGFNFTHFPDQLKQMRHMGGMASIMSKLSDIGQLPNNVKLQMDDNVIVRMEAIIIL